MASSYRIADEPRASTVSRLAVDPLWPFLGAMFGGTWLSWPWFAFNSFSIGSATRARELGLLAGGLLLMAGLTLSLGLLAQSGVVGEKQAPYLPLVVIAVKLLVVYRVHLLQARSHQLFEYFGGVSRNGMAVLVVAFLVRASMVKAMQGTIWMLVLL